MKKTAILLNLTLCLWIASPVIAHEGHNEAFGGGESTVTTSTQKIQVSKEGQQAIGVKTITVAPGALNRVLQATGKVQAAENRAYDINPQVSGIVSAIYAKQGDSVHAGQVLANIHSVEVANVLTQLLQDKARIQADITKAQTQYQRDIAVQANEVEMTRASFQREQTLLNEGITARKDYIEAKNAYETAQVKLAALRKQSVQDVSLLQQQLALTIGAVKSQLKVMGLSGAGVNQALATGRVTSEIPIVSPVSGTVTFRDISLGENLDPGKKIFSIVRLRPIWVIVDIFQEQLSQIRIGQSVAIKTPSGQVIHGDISSIGTIIDPEKRTLPVRVVTDNPTGELKPGMFVTAEVVVGQTGGSRIVIPASALIEDNGRNLVYVQYGNYFQPATVQVGQRTSEQVEILDGLYEGDQIVIQGASQLHAQSLLASKTQKATVTDEHDEKPASNSLSLFLGILIGVGLSILLGVLGWFLLLKRKKVSVR